MKSRRGISSVVGMVFAIIAIVTTVGYVTFSLNVLDSYNQSVLARNQMSIDAGKEKLDLYSVKTTNYRFNVTIANSGNLPINITRMWVQNTTATDWVYYYTINKLVSPGALLTNIGVNSPVSYNSANMYNLKLITGRGNSMQFSLGSPSAKPLFTQLQIIPGSIHNQTNATLIYTVTNNMTSSNLLTNLAASISSCVVSPTQNGRTVSAVLLSGPIPPQYPSLQSGGTVLFKWVYNMTGYARSNIKCTASLGGSNPSSDTVWITTK
jgi:hypothetical protein